MLLVFLFQEGLRYIVLDSYSGIDKSRLIVKHNSSKDMEKRYEHLRELGAGASGCVSLVRDRATAQTLVRKTISLAAMTPSELEDTRKEIALLSALDHPGVVKMFEHCEDSVQKELTLILEHMRGGTVDDLLGYRNLPPTEAWHNTAKDTLIAYSVNPASVPKQMFASVCTEPRVITSECSIGLPSYLTKQSIKQSRYQSSD